MGLLGRGDQACGAMRLHCRWLKPVDFTVERQLGGDVSTSGQTYPSRIPLRHARDLALTRGYAHCIHVSHVSHHFPEICTDPL